MRSLKGIALLCAALISVGSAVYVPTVNAADTDGVSTVSVYESKHKLANSNADEVTQRTYDYICDNFGKYIISGQQESTWMDNNPDYEMDYIEKNTGKLPAIRGLDFMNADFDGVVQRAKDWNAKGGIVTICWHTGVNGGSYNDSLNDNPNFNNLLTPGTTQYNNMIANWDQAAEALKELQDAGVTVLWRPFHEFDGQWFWWGKGGADNFKKLWQMMYDRFTKEHGLNNLIWVLGYSGEVKSNWYPGDEYCDIIGSDTYDNWQRTNKNAWGKLQKVTEAEKPLAFHECGNLPTVQQFEQDGCIWSWFMVWHTSHITGNNKSNLNEVYNSQRVITLDELPDLTSYVSDEVTPPEPESSESESSSEIVADPSSSSEVEDSSSNTESTGNSSIASVSTDSSKASSTNSSSKAPSSANGTSDNSPNTGVAAGFGALAIIAAGAVMVSRKKNK